MFAGKYDLRYFENNSQKRKLAEIKIHPDWKFNAENFDADIALATFEYPVSFTRSVQPICLPNYNSVFIHPLGTVVGWGKSETSDAVRQPHESIPKQINVKAVTNDVCFVEYIEFAKISSPRTFCAGWPGQNVGPCHGKNKKTKNCFTVFFLFYVICRRWFRWWLVLQNYRDLVHSRNCFGHSNR